MAVEGIHYLSLSKAKDRYASVTAEFAQAKQQLAEATAMGDLRENSEYDAAKSTVGRLARELDDLQPVLAMEAIRANDSVMVIQEGCVIELTIHKLTKDPVTPGTQAFEDLKQGTPAFHGILAYGASMPFQELLVDNILSTNTQVGKFLLGKKPGEYTVEVDGGFSNLTVEKVYEINSANYLFCEVGGERHAEK